MRTRRLPLVVAFAVAVTLAGCEDPASTSTSTSTATSTATSTGSSTGADLGGDLTVFAASSLTNAFTEIGDAFTAAHPDVDVTLSFAASSDLAAQVLEGAPADVFASADTDNMAKLTDQSATADAPATFARNSLAIMVEAGNPLDITGLDDLTDDLVVISCDPDVPIGRYTQEVLANAGVDVAMDSFEENVRAVVGKVVAGEADAGVVYATDVAAAGDGASGVAIPADVNIVADYPIAVTADAPHPATAAEFVAFVLGPEGQDILSEYGFGPA
ncbi:molybdate ABC transporter substrate-binding protein [soil metagenome]